MEKASFEKLDYELARLVEKSFDEGGKFPIVVRLSDFAFADDLEACLSDVSGDVRHRLELLNAVSAWIPLGAVGRVAELDFVEELELAQPERVARA